MKSRYLAALGAALGVALSASSAFAGSVTINFDNLANDVVVTNQYAEATFSSDLGQVILTSNQVPPYQTSAPNFICTGFGLSITCTGNVFVNFTNPVNNLTFNSTGADNAGPAQGNVDVWTTGGFAGSVSIPGIGQVTTAQFVDLSAFHNITQIEIDNVIDPAGLAYDDFSFDVSRGVPEPDVWALMILGFAAMGFPLRRHRLSRA